MGFDVSGMADFIKGDPQTILTDIIMEAQSFNGMLRIVDDIKASKKVVDITDNEVIIQGGDYTGYDGFSGDDTFKDVLVTVSELHVKKQYKKRELEAKVTGLAYKQGSNPDEVAYNDVLMNLNGQALAYNNDVAIWQGDVLLTGDTTKLHFDGLFTQINASGDKIKTGTAAVPLTSSTAIAAVERMVNKMEDNFPNWVSSETQLFMAPRNFQKYYRALFGLSGVINADSLENAPITSIRVPGTNVTAIATTGLDGSNEMVLTRPNNLIVGTDLVSENDELTFIYSNDAKWYELFALYKLGAKVVRTAECIIEAA